MYGDMDQDGKDELLAILRLTVQDQNGDDVYKNERTHLGYLDPRYKLVVPADYWKDCEDLDEFPVDLKELGKINGIMKYLGEEAKDHQSKLQYLTKTASASDDDAIELVFWKIAVANYLKLANSGIEADQAAYAGMFRARWCITGGLHALAKSSHKPGDEVIKADDTTRDSGIGSIMAAKSVSDLFDQDKLDLAPMIKVLARDNHGVNWVVGISENVWCAVEHAFRVRGHHFISNPGEKEGYEALYNRFMTACYEGKWEIPEGFEWEIIAHTAIHPFKVQALPQVMAHYTAYGLVSPSATLRTSGAPTGHAVITTTSAALNTMASEVWYPTFKSIYSVPIGILNNATKAIKGNKYGYHKSASLYGVTPEKNIMINGEPKDLEEVKGLTSVVGAAAAGLIAALAEVSDRDDTFAFALSNAKALKKAESNNPLMAIRVKELIIAAVESVTEAKGMVAAIKAALPQIAAATGVNTGPNNEKEADDGGA
jgi:hypothetical protein